MRKLKIVEYAGRKIQCTKYDNAVKCVVMPLGPTSVEKTKDEALKNLKFQIDRKDRARKIQEESYKLRFKTKRLYYYKIIRSNPRNVGGRNVTAEVFKHTPDGLRMLGEVKWNTAGYKGEKSEVLDFLKKIGEVPKNMFPDGYYGWNDAEKYNMKIEGI